MSLGRGRTPQSPGAVAITGGSIDGTTVGATTPASGKFTTLEATGKTTLGAGLVTTPRVVTAAGAVTITAADYVVIVKKTVGAATAVNLEATPVTGATKRIKDGKGDAAANPLTITPAAGTIDGGATLVLSTNYASVDLIYNGTEWNAL